LTRPRDRLPPVVVSCVSHLNNLKCVIGMADLLKQLDVLGLDLIILKDGVTIFSRAGDGIIPLMEAVEALGLEQLNGSVVADKVVGKAAGLIIGYFKARYVHTKVLSKRGALILDACGIGCCTEEIVEEILNKDGTDMCPFERAVLNIEDPMGGYEVLNKTAKGVPRRT